MGYSVVEEATLKTLAVMTKADSNIREVEVELVQKVLKDELGLEVTSADVRVAAHDEFIEGRKVAKYLKKIESKLNLEDKKHIVRALVQVAQVDDKTSHGEAELFNDVVAALKLTPADVVHL